MIQVAFYVYQYFRIRYDAPKVNHHTQGEENDVTEEGEGEGEI